MPVAAGKGGRVIDDDAIRKVLLRFAGRRSKGKTFCPSEVARAMAEDWRPLMPHVRRVAAVMVEEGSLVCTQRGNAVHPLRARGAIRLKSAAIGPDGA